MAMQILLATSPHGIARAIRRGDGAWSVERVLSGHLHRSISRRFAGTIALTAPGTAHAVQLDLGDDGAAWNREPPAILLHLLMPTGGVVTHLEVIGDHDPVSFGI